MVVNWIGFGMGITEANSNIAKPVGSASFRWRDDNAGAMPLRRLPLLMAAPPPPMSLLAEPLMEAAAAAAAFSTKEANTDEAPRLPGREAAEE